MFVSSSKCPFSLMPRNSQVALEILTVARHYIFQAGRCSWIFSCSLVARRGEKEELRRGEFCSSVCRALAPYRNQNPDCRYIQSATNRSSLCSSRACFRALSSKPDRRGAHEPSSDGPIIHALINYEPQLPVAGRYLREPQVI